MPYVEQLLIKASWSRSSYFLILLLLITFAVHHHHHLTSAYHSLTTTTHFHVDTTTNTLSYNITLTLSLPSNNFPSLGLRLVSIRTFPAIYSVRHSGSSAVKSPLFIGPEHVTWRGWNAVVCDFSSVEYYRKEPMGKFSIHIKVYLHTRYKLGGLVTPPLGSTAECELELPLSTTSDGVYGGSFGPTKCG